MTTPIKSEIDQFHPTLVFGFQGETLCQLWVSPLGATEYRPVPMVELNEAKKPCVTGFVGDSYDDD